jgi:anti-sigma B factor antagonist
VSSFSAGPCLVVVVAGEADCLTAPQLRDQLTAALAYGPRSLILDLTDLVFCNLLGLRALLDVIETARQGGVDVAMRGMSRQLSCLHRRYAAHARTGGQLAHLADWSPASPSTSDAVRSSSSV